MPTPILPFSLGVTAIASSVLPRLTTTVVGLPARSPTALMNESGAVMGAPSTDMTRSPALKPACAAAWPGMTWEIWRSPSLNWTKPTVMAAKSRTRKAVA
ncbi:hypothetical protein D3C86_1916960 [compost metagenome]